MWLSSMIESVRNDSVSLRLVFYVQVFGARSVIRFVVWMINYHVTISICAQSIIARWHIF